MKYTHKGQQLLCTDLGEEEVEEDQLMFTAVTVLASMSPWANPMDPESSPTSHL